MDTAGPIGLAKSILKDAEKRFGHPIYIISSMMISVLPWIFGSLKKTPENIQKMIFESDLQF